jgi:hypothetical protein
MLTLREDEAKANKPIITGQDHQNRNKNNQLAREPIDKSIRM